MPLSEQMRRDLGMTVAVWWPPELPARTALGFLRRTLDDVELFVHPQRLCLVVDGAPWAEEPTHEAAREVERRCGAPPRVVASPVNEGQGGAVARGLEVLLEEAGVTALCTRDMDGDHDVYDTPQLYRRLRELEEGAQTDRVLVVGVRGNRHRPMGYARGELEQVLNEVTVGALTAAGRPPALQHCAVYEPFPDFQSGFKLYTRWSARAAAQALRQAHAVEPDGGILRWGVQFVSTVELLLAGAVPACVYRLTYDQQPQTTFEGHDNLARAYGCQLAWLFQRLATPPEAAWPLLDNALAALGLATAPGGWETVLSLRGYIAEKVWGEAPPPPPVRGAMF